MRIIKFNWGETLWEFPEGKKGGGEVASGTVLPDKGKRNRADSKIRN